MLPYRLLYSKNSVLILAMILIPIFGMGIMFAILLNLPKDLPDLIIYILIVFFLIVLVISLLLIIKKYLNVSCTTFVIESGISFRLEITDGPAWGDCHSQVRRLKSVPYGASKTPGRVTETPFEHFLAKHDEEAWLASLTVLLRSIHEVDKTATQIWFFWADG